MKTSQIFWIWDASKKGCTTVWYLVKGQTTKDLKRGEKLKRLNLPYVIVKDQSSHLVCPNKNNKSMNIMQNLCAFRCIIIRCCLTNIWVRNDPFLNYITLEGAVLTMFYTINSSPLLVTKFGFMQQLFWVNTSSVQCL